MMAAMRPPWQRSYSAVAENAAEQRQHDINHAHAHKFTMSLALSLVCRLACYTGAGIAPSRSQCFIAAGNALLLASSSCARTHTYTHTHTRAHSDSAHSLRAKADRRRAKQSERERASSCFCVKHMLGGVVVGGEERKKEREVIKLGRRTGLSEAAAS